MRIQSKATKYKENIIKWRLEGQSLELIGSKVGLTRERIRQILLLWGVTPSGRGSRRTLKRIEINCNNPECSKLFETTEKYNRKYCSYNCFQKCRRRTTPAQKRELARIRKKHYYHTYLKFVYKDKFKKWNKEQAEKNKHKCLNCSKMVSRFSKRCLKHRFLTHKEYARNTK